MAIEAALVGGMIELAKMGLMIWIQASTMANMTDEEKEKMFQEAKAEFEKRSPDKLPDIT